MMIHQTVFQGWATARPFLFFDLRAKTSLRNTGSKIDAVHGFLRLSLLFQLGEHVLNKFRTACWKLGGPERLLFLCYTLAGSQIIRFQFSPLLNLINKNRIP
jgi:hypothetical protein